MSAFSAIPSALSPVITGVITPVTLLHMSGAGAMLIVVAVVVRTLALNRLPKGAFSILWGLALFRLLVPVAISCPWSIYGLFGSCFPALAEHFAPGQTAWLLDVLALFGVSDQPTAGLSHVVTVTTRMAQNAQDAPISPTTPDPVTLSVTFADPSALSPGTILTLLWLLGVGVCVIVFAVAYRRCWWLVRTSFPVDASFAKQWLANQSLTQPLRWRTVTIRQSRAVSSPLTFGVWRPVILMPQSTDWDDTETLPYVLAHEYAHIRRWDALTKYAIIIALCVHWFNPLVWVLYHLANRDIELACDAAVIRQFGQENKAHYARALIRMEERRMEEQKSGFIPFCSGFGKNNRNHMHTMEERIVAIMKTSALSRLSLGMTGALLVGVTTAFATAAQPSPLHSTAEATSAPSVSVPTPEDSATQPGTAASGDVETDREGEVTITSYTDPETGVTSYQLDDGTTTRALSEDELQTGYTTSNIEWWTYDEYKAWLDQEKVELQKMLGCHAWTSHDGDFVWTQDKIDETIAMYEDTLQQIKDGLMVSKSIDGKTDMVLAMGADMGANLSAGEDVTITVTKDDPTSDAAAGSAGSVDAQVWTDYTVVTPDSATLKGVDVTGDVTDYAIQLVSYDEYAPYGLTYDPQKNELTYKGQLVRYFFDGVDLGDGGIASRAEFLNENGVIDVHTVRRVVDNGDGSKDPFGPLQAIVPYSQAEFDSRDLSALSPEQEAEATSDVMVTVTKGAEGQAIQAESADSVGSADPADPGVTFAERFALYKPYGITFEEAKEGEENTVGQVYYNGTRVRKFVDIKPNGDTFTFNYAIEDETLNASSVNVKTVYDDKGNLTGVATF